MAESATAGGEQEFAELLGFLQDQKLEVRRFAAEGVLAQTEDKEFLEYCREHPRAVAKPLLRLVERAEADVAANSTAGDAAGNSDVGKKAARMAALEGATAEAAGSAALQALVNLSGIPSVLSELVGLNAARRCAGALRSGWLEGRAELAHWHAMLLANLTTTKDGQEAMCADDGLLRFVLAAYIANPRPPPRDGYNDPLLWLGKVIGNVCALSEGRRLLVSGDGGAATLATLMGELRDRDRRPDVIHIVKNVCLDTACHDTVASTVLLVHLAKFLYPWERADPDLRGQLPEQLRSTLADDGAAMTGDAPVRHAAAVSLLGLCLTAAGREYLRALGGCEVARAWQCEETEEETRGVLAKAIASIQCSEEELQTQRAQPVQDAAVSAPPAPTGQAAPAAAIAVPPAAEPAQAPAPVLSAPAGDKLPPDAKATVGELPPDAKATGGEEQYEKLAGIFDDVD